MRQVDPALPGCHLQPQHFAESAQILSKRQEASVWHQPGGIPVLITCVHGHPHLRDGQTKPMDTGTLEGSHLLSHVTGAHWLAVGRAQEPDSNHHRNTEFKQWLQHLAREHDVRLVVDLHASHAARPYDIDVGSLRGLSWLGHEDWRQSLFVALQGSGFLVTDNAVFRAEGSTPEAETVTAFAARQLNIPAVQLEVSSALLADLSSRQALHQHAKLVNALADFILRATRAPS